MKVHVKSWHAIAQWRWDTGADNDTEDADGEGDVCGICRVSYEGCCPSCKMPGDDCPLSASTFIVLSPICVEMCSLFSLGGVHACFPYALSTEVDWNGIVEAAMSNGPQAMG